MSSFPSMARRVRNPDLPPCTRFYAFRECVLCFPLYGFRATWHHLTADFPGTFAEAPLLAALTELEQARDLWQAMTEQYARRRRREKAVGQRLPRQPRWYSHPGEAAYCPDFRRHPRERLEVVVTRLIANWSDDCPVCGRQRDDGACLHCGIGVPAPKYDGFPWQETWHRTAAWMRRD